MFSTGMAKFTPDENIWNYAGANGFTIVTADSDFLKWLERRGTLPKIVLLKNCNYKTGVVEDLLRRNAIRITELENSDHDRLIVRNSK